MLEIEFSDMMLRVSRRTNHLMDLGLPSTDPREDSTRQGFVLHAVIEVLQELQDRINDLESRDVT